MAKKLELDIEYIVKLYSDGQSIEAISRTLGVSGQTVTRRLDNQGLDKKARKQMRDDSKQYKNKTWLRHQYYDLKRSQQQIGNKCGVRQAAIQRTMIEFKMKPRSLGFARHLLAGNHFHITLGLIEFFNGCLLGDGYVGSDSKYSAHYEHASKHANFIAWIIKKLNSYGITTGDMKKRIIDNPLFHKPAAAYSCVSKAYPEFLPLRKKWYPDGRKILPKDIELTPTACLLWYLGDGCLSNSRKSRPNIRLSTHCFIKKDVLRLIDKLKELGISANYWPSNNSIGIGVDNTPKFLAYIGPCPSRVFSSYGYKWDLLRSKKEWEAEFGNDAVA